MCNPSSPLPEGRAAQTYNHSCSRYLLRYLDKLHGSFDMSSLLELYREQRTVSMSVD